MSDSTATITEAAPTETQGERPADVKRLRWFELSLVLLVAYGISFLNSLYLLANGPSTMPHISDATWSIGIVQEATALLLLGYVLSRRNLQFKDLGLRWSLRDVGVGLLVAGASYATYAIGYLLVRFLHHAISASVAGVPAQVTFSRTLRSWPFRFLF